MNRRIGALGGMAVLAVAAVFGSIGDSADGTPPPRGDAVIYVTGQGLYYDSIVNGPLPPKGPFQLLEMDADGQPFTEFGPGDPGYLGGRWKADFDGDGVYDYFSCPLLPPGREMP